MRVSCNKYYYKPKHITNPLHPKLNIFPDNAIGYVLLYENIASTNCMHTWNLQCYKNLM